MEITLCFQLKGRAIQVEDGLGERQPSIDARLPVHRDSDVVIEVAHSHHNSATSSSICFLYDHDHHYYYYRLYPSSFAHCRLLYKTRRNLIQILTRCHLMG